MEVQLHAFLTSALYGVSQLYATVDLPPGVRSLGNHWVGGWVGPRGGLETW